MSLAYILPGGLNDPPGAGTDLYDGFPSIRQLYADVAEWTATPLKRLLAWEHTAEREYQEIGTIRQAAIIFGVCDLLAERGVHPGSVAGLSFGSLLGACIAGAIAREDLFRLLAHLREFSGPSGPPQGVAALATPANLAWDEYLNQAPDGIYVAGDLGIIAGGNVRLLLIAGHRSGLEELARKLPDKAVGMSAATRAHHSPLNSRYRDHLELGMEKIPFRNPVVPLCSCIEQKTITTAAEVRELFIENQVHKVSVPYLAAELDEHALELALVIGPARMEIWVDNLSAPLVQVEQADHIVEALTAISELGVSLSSYPTIAGGCSDCRQAADRYRSHDQEVARLRSR